MIRGNKTTVNSGAVGDSRGVVQNMAPLQDRELITDGSDSSAWTILGDDTENLADGTNHIIGSKSISFDKLDGAGNTINAGIFRSDLDLDLSRFLADDIVNAQILIPDKTNLASVEIRFGTDASNYSAFNLADAGITQAVWQEIKLKLSEVTLAVTGNGANWSSIKYVAFIAIFDLETNALANMLVDHILVRSVNPAS